MSFGRLERTPGPRPMSEINMTPLIDVMLVLLVIFMIAAPLMTTRLSLELPKADTPPPSDTPAFIAVALSADGELHFGDERLASDAFEAKVRSAARANPALEVHLRADKGVAYGRVAELIGLLQTAGLNRIAFVAEPKGP